MHIAEGYLPPLHAVAWTAVAAPFVVHGARVVEHSLAEVRGYKQAKKAAAKNDAAKAGG